MLVELSGPDETGDCRYEEKQSRQNFNYRLRSAYHLNLDAPWPRYLEADAHTAGKFSFYTQILHPEMIQVLIPEISRQKN
jgi:hypothetical protein